MTDAERRGHPSEVLHRDALRVGFVTRAHGLTGALEVRLDWPDGRGLFEAKEIILEAKDGEREEREVVAVRPTPKGVLLSLRGVEDRDAAEARKGRLVLLPRGVLPDLEEGEYYLSDLVGCSVSGVNGSRIGTVVEVQMYPSVDAIVIEGEGGARWEQPLLDEWIEEVNLNAKRIVLTSADGLIDVSSNGRSASDERDFGATKG